jgi:glycosyltransferase involved in cell wall biosynthesis
MTVAPTVSIVTATYNRSNILRYTIESVLRQTYTDWELLVVGDACTDDTEAVVAQFGDTRIHYTNLEENCGDQSGPNNVAIQMARGQYIAFLNHDDLYFQDHIETSLDEIRTTEADLIFSTAAIVQPSRPESRERDDWDVRITAATPAGAYEPYVFSPASTWLMRRDLADQIGPWCTASETWWMPSQEFLFRAWQSGEKLRAIKKVTVLALHSGRRPGAYKRRDFEENAYFGARMASDQRLREILLSCAAATMAREQRLKEVTFSPMEFLLRCIWQVCYRPLLWLRLNPMEVRALLLFRKKGGYISHLRRLRGLED